MTETEGVYNCTKSNSFSCVAKFQARDHLANCGLSKKRGRKMKKCTCIECNKEFPSKIAMQKHYKEEHPSRSYTFSSVFERA